MRWNWGYCNHCGKEQTEAEYLVGQCNDCDPFMRADELIEIYGEPEYKDVDSDDQIGEKSVDRASRICNNSAGAGNQ